MAAGEQMKRVRTLAPRIRRERQWPEDLPADPRDPDVVRAKALARAGLASVPHPNGEGQSGKHAEPTRSS
jgi:hypothetical protein